MNRPLLTVCTAAFVFLVCSVSAFASPLVASVYPNAVKSRSDDYVSVYLTNDSLSTVRKFYEGRGLHFTDKDEGTNSVSVNAVVLDALKVCEAQDAARTPLTAPQGAAADESMNYDTDTAGVSVIGSKPPPAEHNAYALNFDRTSVFSGLQNEALNGRHTSGELVTVYNKYRWLETAFYPRHKTAKGTESYYHWLVAKTWAHINAPQKAVNAAGAQMAQGAAAVAARMQKLIAEGHMKEAQQLGRQMAGAMQGEQQVANGTLALHRRDHWKEWMEVVKKLAAHAYRTKVVINTKPGGWPVHNVCGG